MASPSWIWNVSYMSVHDLDNGVRNLKDGEIQGWSSSNWIILLDDKRVPIFGRSIHKDVDVFKVGSVIEFPEFHAFIDHCISPATDDYNVGSVHCSPTDQAAVDLKGKSKVVDPTSTVINSKASSSLADLAPPSKI
jgi:hypothetical protein